jgi:hypothetical protein
MLRILSRCLLVACLLPLSPPRGLSQVGGTPPHRVVGIRQITQRAGFIFVGRVASVAAVAPLAPGTVRTVEITFQVEQAIRGTRAGETLTIREWPGLWRGEERYRVGQRMLLVLYPPSKVGLTSPVGGAAGRFAVDRSGRVVLSPIQQQWLNAGAAISPDEGHRLPLRDLAGAVRRAAKE